MTNHLKRLLSAEVDNGNLILEGAAGVAPHPPLGELETWGAFRTIVQQDGGTHLLRESLHTSRGNNDAQPQTWRLREQAIAQKMIQRIRDIGLQAFLSKRKITEELLNGQLDALLSESKEPRGHMIDLLASKQKATAQ